MTASRKRYIHFSPSPIIPHFPTTPNANPKTPSSSPQPRSTSSSASAVSFPHLPNSLRSSSSPAPSPHPSPPHYLSSSLASSPLVPHSVSVAAHLKVQGLRCPPPSPASSA